MSDLESVIQDSIQDVELPEPLETSEADNDPNPTDQVELAPETTDDLPEAPEVQVPSQDAPVLDEFDKKYGLAPNSSSGRENRIPYSRVKKIADNSAKEAVTKAQEGWTKGLETTHVPVARYQELNAKVTDYESRLQGVARYEDILQNKPIEFLKKLVQMPQYAAIFNQQQQTDQAQPQQSQAQVNNDPMPQPDQDGGNGNLVYSMDGLNKLLDWNARQAENRVLQKMESRYKPLEDDYKRYQQVQQVMPAVQQQIADARTWKLFNENEGEIVKILQQYPDASLERAYQHVVWPKLQAELDGARSEQETLKTSAKADRDKIRAEVLAELKAAPRSTSATTTGTQGRQVSSGGSRSLEDIIKESIKPLK